MSTLNGSQSALAAGYCTNNPQNAHITAWTLLKREDVQARLEELRKEAVDDAVMSLRDRRLVLSQIARACIGDYQDENGQFRPLDKNSPNPSAIAEVTYAWNSIKKESYPVRIRLHDAIDAIAELCKLDGLYKGKKVEVNVAPITSVVVVGDAPPPEDDTRQDKRHDREAAI